MSYTIVYDRRFLKCGDLYIPMALYGDNNVTEFSAKTGREVRVRDWNTFLYSDDMLLATGEKIMEIVNRFHAKDSKDGESFKYHGKLLNNAETYRFFENGIRDAMSIEEIKMQVSGIYLTGSTRVYKEGFIYSQELSERETTLYSTKQVIDWVQKAKQKREGILNAGTAESVYIVLKFDTKEPIRVTKVESGKVAFKAQNGSAGYVCGVEDRKLSFDCRPENAMIFDSAEEAYVAIPTWTKKYVRLIKASEVERKATEEKPYVLSMMNGGLRVYLTKKTRGRVYCSKVLDSQVKRFPSESAALRWFKDKVEGRFALMEPKAVKA